MLVFVLNQAQKANTGKIQTPVYENVREFGLNIPESKTATRGLLFCSRKEAMKTSFRRDNVVT